MIASQINPSLEKIIEGCFEFQVAADELINSGVFGPTFEHKLNQLVKELRDVRMKCREARE